MLQEIFKQKVEKLINHFNKRNYPLVIRESKLLLQKLPNNAFLLNLIGSCYQKSSDLRLAKKIFEEILQVDNKNTAAFNNLGNVHKDLKDFPSAENSYIKALDLNPNYISALVNYGSLKYELNKHEEAIEFYKKALNLDSKIPMAHYNLGLVYQALGHFKKSKFHLEELLKITPKATYADKILSRFTKYNVGDSHIDLMEKKLNELDLNEFEKTNLFFALGKAYEDLKNYEKSFFYLKKGNDIKKKLSNYNIEKDVQFFEILKKNFLQYDFKKNNVNKYDKKIIFIVGMPRSGTTLVEQIISSHSNVYGAGELPYLENIVTKEFFENKSLNIYKLQELNNTKKLKEIGDRYMSLINNYNCNKDLVTDKAPLNFRWIGLIKLILPNSKIIHCSRSPKDNCLSLYKNIFDDNLDWTYNESDISTFYQEYLNLMIFWKKNIPDSIYDIKYENLITDTKNEIKNLLNFCDLKWEQDCLEFYKNKRAIKTVSSAQARESLYKSSIDSSSNYKKFLPDLFTLLEKL